jgi:dolichyl-phosphate-mannose-protein mannosyltransferase
MIESNSVEIGSGDLAPVFRPSRSIPATLEALRTLVIALLVTAAVTVRLGGLGATGFSEDEVNKLRAVAAYRHGDVTANAEHPMLMKLAMLASVSTADWWNRHPRLTALGTISPEAALRGPNAIVGGVTAGVVFLLAEALFDTAVGLWAACFWAFDVNAAAVNRIGKEDTFLLFFLLAAAWCYERAKTAAPADRDPWYRRSAASFGLMLASKYMPHYFALHAVFNVAADRNPADKTPDKRKSFFAVMAAVFLAANVALAFPGTWRYLHGYARGDTLRHTGYTFAHRLYVNGLEATPWGLPPWFYATFFATKVPILVLALAAAGVVWAWRHRDERGATFIRVFLFFTLIPYSLVASKFLRYMLPVLAVLDIAAAIGITWLIRRLDDVRSELVRGLAPAALSAAVVLALAGHAAAAAPLYALSQNAVAARLFAPGSLFPDDEFYDAGVREAVDAIAGTAAPGAFVCSDATTVVETYLARAGRDDIKACSIAHDGLPTHAVDTWVIVQDGHTYFENAAVVDALQRRLTPWRDIRVDGVSAAKVYHLPGQADRGADP